VFSRSYWHDTVVCVSAMLCIVALMVDVEVESCTVVFIGGDFLFTSDTFAVGIIV